MCVCVCVCVYVFVCVCVCFFVVKGENNPIKKRSKILRAIIFGEKFIKIDQQLRKL